MKRTVKQYVIVRCTGAGVWAGYLQKKEGAEVILSDARRLWRWWSIFSLSELATHGPRPDKIAENRYAEPVPVVTLRDWCEIIPCSAKGCAAVRGVANANQ